MSQRCAVSVGGCIKAKLVADWSKIRGALSLSLSLSLSCARRIRTQTVLSVGMELEIDYGSPCLSPLPRLTIIFFRFHPHCRIVVVSKDRKTAFHKRF